MSVVPDQFAGSAWLYPTTWELVVYFVKASAASAVALGILAAMKNRSALSRYLVAKVTLVTLLVIPVATLLLPRWDLSMAEGLASVLPSQVVVSAAPTTSSTAAADAEGALALWPAIAVGLWLIGVLTTVVRMMVGQRSVTRLVREAESFRNSIERRSLTVSVGIPDSVPVVVGNTAVPFAVGARRGVIVLPKPAWQWPDTRVRMVLRHEYTHLKRFDTAWIGLGNVIRAIHWFNPIVRVIHGVFLNECERACDDAVLAYGESPESYAQCLIDGLRAAARPRWSTAVGATMARTTNMEGRLMSILTDRKRTTRLSHGMRFAVVVLAAVLLLPISAWQAQAADTTKVAAEKKADKEETKEKELKKKQKQFEELEELPGEHEFVEVEIYPEMLRMTSPEYPRSAKKAGIEGRVWVKALVDKNGKTREVIIAKSSGNAELDEAAHDAAMTARFKPGIRDGKPVAVWVTFSVEFKLDEEAKE